MRNVYKGRLLKKSKNYMAFKHCISFASDLAANFDCDQFRITADIDPKLLCAAI